MEQLKLLDIEPTKRSASVRFRMWRAEHRVWTYRSGGIEEPWCALQLEEGDKQEPMEAISSDCMHLEGCGRLVYGRGEYSACLKLAENLGIPFPPS